MLSEQKLPKRPMKQAIKRGAMCKCPNCGEASLFDGYLKVKDNCPSCREDFTHQRADDGPAWATMLITGHLIPPVILAIYDNFESPNTIVVAVLLVILFSAITLILLPRTKGVFVAVQWANYMYGFNPTKSGEKKAEMSV